MYWFYVLPLGFLLTQYTITGFDASAHISEETHGASTAAAKGVWRSIFYSAVIGWIVLLAITFAVTNVDGANEASGFAPTLLVEALGSGWGKFVLIISVVGQLFCGAACLTSASRMCYAFSRDNGFGKRVSSKISRVNEQAGADLRGAVDGDLLALDHHPAGAEGQVTAKASRSPSSRSSRSP